MTKKHIDDTSSDFKFFAIILLTLGVFFVIITCFIGHETFKLRNEQKKERETLIGKIEHPCVLKLNIEYDKEPVDVTIIAPSGKKYTIKNAPDYTDSGTTQIFTFITQDIGEWSMEYTKKTNEHLNAFLKIEPAERLFLTDIQINTQQPGALTINFNSIYGNGSDTESKINCCVIASSRQLAKSLVIWDQPISINGTTQANCDVSKMETATDWKITISTYKSLDNTNQNLLCNYSAVGISYQKP